MAEELGSPTAPTATNDSLQQSSPPFPSRQATGDENSELSPPQNPLQKQRRKTSSSAEVAAFDFDSSPAPHQGVTNFDAAPDSSLQSATAVAVTPAVNPDQVLSSQTTTVATTDTSLTQPADDIPSLSSEVSLASPPLKLTLLCTTGSRVALTLDQKFITSHSLPVKDPDSITVSQFKQVIYNEWMSSQKKAEGDDDKDSTLQELGKNTSDPDNSSTGAPTHTKNWGSVLASGVSPVPASPDHIRLIHLGKVLVDDYTLEDYKISSSNSFNVLHLSVRPESMGAKDKSGGGKQGRTKRRTSAPTGQGRLSTSNSRRGDGDNNTADNSVTRNSQSRSGCCIIS